MPPRHPDPAADSRQRVMLLLCPLPAKRLPCEINNKQSCIFSAFRVTHAQSTTVSPAKPECLGRAQASAGWRSGSSQSSLCSSRASSGSSRWQTRCSARGHLHPMLASSTDLRKGQDCDSVTLTHHDASNLGVLGLDFGDGGAQLVGGPSVGVQRGGADDVTKAEDRAVEAVGSNGRRQTDRVARWLGPTVAELTSRASAQSPAGRSSLDKWCRSRQCSRASRRSRGSRSSPRPSRA